MNKRKKHRKIWHCFAGIALFAAAIAVVMFLWNAIIPGVTGWGTLGYLQAAGLFLLTRILFGGHGHGHFCGPGRHFGGWQGHKAKQEMHEQMKGMSWSERKEYIRERMAQMHDWDLKCGPCSSEPTKEDEHTGA